MTIRQGAWLMAPAKRLQAPPKVTRAMAGQSFGRPPIDLGQLSMMARQMVDDALQAFVQHDTQMAIQVARGDAAADDLCEQVQQEMMNLMRSDASRVEQATRLLLVAPALESVADHATNIAEQVYYAETGDMRPLVQAPRRYCAVEETGRSAGLTPSSNLYAQCSE